MNSEERSNEEIRALCDAATPGPWGAADEHGLWPGAAPAWCVSRMDGEKWLYDVFYHASQSDGDQAQRDSEFVAAARTAVPSLLARIAAVEAEADRWDGGVEAGRAHVAACQIHPCPRCVVAEAAIDLRAVLTEGAS